jgi:hypothetical protein
MITIWNDNGKLKMIELYRVNMRCNDLITEIYLPIIQLNDEGLSD